MDAVADDRMPPLRELDADLMAPPGAEAEDELGHVAAPLQHTKVGDGLAPPRAPGRPVGAPVGAADLPDAEISVLDEETL